MCKPPDGPMSLVDWYLHKAEQCELKAKEAADPQTRARYYEEQKLWREFAEREGASIDRIIPGDHNLTTRKPFH